MKSGESKDGRKALGTAGERIAADYLLGKGMRIVARNWRCRAGEIDLIAEEGDTLVFVEVRTRRSTGTFGLPEESIDSRKQRQVRETAAWYLQQIRGFERRVRFDAVAVQLDTAGSLQDVRHVTHAF